MLKINKKNFQDEEMAHELFLKTRQTIKIRNALKKCYEYVDRYKNQ